MPRGALVLALLGLGCVALFAGHGVGRTELISSKHGGGSDNIFAETGVRPDAPKRPMVHHPHHPTIKPNAMTAEEYEARLGKDIHGRPLPKKAKKAEVAAADESDQTAEEQDSQNAVRQTKATHAATLAPGWHNKWDASKGKFFYANPSIKSITWNRATAEVKAVKTANKAPAHDSRAAPDLVKQPPFHHPGLRNPTYEGTGHELNAALRKHTESTQAAVKYHENISAQREQMYEKQKLMHEGAEKKSSKTQQLGSRAFFKFDPIKGSFYKYSPDVGVTAKPGSIADTLAKVAASAKTPTISITAASGPALPNGDISTARKTGGKKLHFSQKKSVDMHDTPAYKAAAAKANSALMNVARAVAMNAGYQPGSHVTKKAAPSASSTSSSSHKTAPHTSTNSKAAVPKSKDSKADVKKGGKGKQQEHKGVAAPANHAGDPDWEARSQMNKVWKGQRSFYKYDVAKEDFYKYTPDASRKTTAGATFAPEDRI